jgi:hypothetical protein
MRHHRCCIFNVQTLFCRFGSGSSSSLTTLWKTGELCACRIKKIGAHLLDDVENGVADVGDVAHQIALAVDLRLTNNVLGLKTTKGRFAKPFVRAAAQFWS